VVGLAPGEAATLEYEVEGDSCARRGGRRQLLASAGGSWLALAPDARGCEDPVRLTYRLQDESVAHVVRARAPPAEREATLSASLEALPAGVRPRWTGSDVTLAPLRAAYELRGALSYEGPCVSCFLDDLRARLPERRFSSLAANEDGRAVYFRAGVVLPASRKAATLSFRRAASAAARAGGGSASLWASPLLVAEMQVRASGAREDRIALALASAALVPERPPRRRAATLLLLAAFCACAACGAVGGRAERAPASDPARAQPAAERPQNQTPQQQDARRAPQPQSKALAKPPAPAPLPARPVAAAATAEAPQRRKMLPSDLQGAIIVPWTAPGSSQEPETPRPKPAQAQAAEAGQQKVVYVRQRAKKMDSFEGI
jgi:hypothetical protein